MNDSRPTTTLRIEGRPTAIADRVVHFGSLAVVLAPNAPTPNLQTHCVMHARLEQGGSWKQADSSFQVIGSMVDQTSQPSRAAATATAADAAPAKGDGASSGPTASTTPSRSTARADEQEAPPATRSSSTAQQATPSPASPASPAATRSPFGGLVGVGAGVASPAGAKPASSETPAATDSSSAGRSSNGGSAFAQLASRGASRPQKPANGTPPNTGFRADQDPLGDVPF